MRAILPILCLVGLLVLGCSKGNPAAPDETPKTVTNRFVINGGGFTSKTLTSLPDSLGGAFEVGGFAQISFVGTTGRANEAFVLSLVAESKNPGTYAILSPGGTSSTLEFGDVDAVDPDETYYGVSGTITIQAFAGKGSRATGTFTLVLQDLSGNQVTVSNGTFNVLIR